jgi:hypothetical protein
VSYTLVTASHTDKQTDETLAIMINKPKHPEEKGEYKEQDGRTHVQEDRQKNHPRGLTSTSPTLSHHEKHENHLRGLTSTSPTLSHHEKHENHRRGLTSTSPTLSHHEKHENHLRGLTSTSPTLSYHEKHIK